MSDAGILQKTAIRHAPSLVRRGVIPRSQEEWVTVEPAQAPRGIPVIVQPALDGIRLSAWAASNREFIDGLLMKHRAILFRRFGITSVAEFEEFVGATSSGDLLEYRDRSTPRLAVGDKVYTSTVYPPEQTINLHNEGTYWLTWPLKLYFCCLKAPQEGGQTPIADVRKVFERLDPAIRERFMEKHMMLVRNYNDGFGLPWQEVFQTTERAEVEEYCRQHSIELEWKGGDRLKTRQVRPVVRRHPRSGESVWFNHAAFFHVSSLEPTIRNALLDEFGTDLPFNTYYGDGTPIEAEVAQHLRDAYEKEKVLSSWQSGDVLMLDNMSVAHGREPFVGERQVIVAMTDACSGDESASQARGAE